jgi:hypothetical protein
MATKKKWDAFKGKIKPFVNEDKSFIERVANLKRDLIDLSNTDLAVDIATLRAQKEELDSQIKGINLHLEACQTILAERFENAGIQSLNIKDHGTFFLRDEPYTSVQNKQAVMKWLQENDMMEIVAPIWSSLNAIVKERLEKGEKLPDGVEVFLKTTVGVRKGS